AELEFGLVRCQRPGSGTGEPPQNKFKRRVEPDGPRLPIQRITRLGIKECAAAEGDHLRTLGLKKARNQLTFHFAEFRLSAFAKELRDRNAGDFLDPDVRVDDR